MSLALRGLSCYAGKRFIPAGFFVIRSRIVLAENSIFITGRNVKRFTRKRSIT